MGNKTRLRIITPERTFFDGDADLVIARTSYGDVGIMAGHIPLTTIIKEGIVTINNDGSEKQAALMGGFCEALAHQVTIVSDSALWPNEIDTQRAEESLKRAQKRVADAQTDDSIDLKRAEVALRRAEVRLTASKIKMS